MAGTRTAGRRRTSGTPSETAPPMAGGQGDGGRAEGGQGDGGRADGGRAAAKAPASAPKAATGAANLPDETIALAEDLPTAAAGGSPTASAGSPSTASTEGLPIASTEGLPIASTDGLPAAAVEGLPIASATSLSAAAEVPSANDIEAATTRERILDIALDLFIRKGYAATSMREIAAPLGISKAALYYHFPSKGHILLELHLQMHRATADFHDIPEPGADDATWLRFVDQLIGLALRNRRIIEFHFRNRDVFDTVHEGPLMEEHTRAHDDQPFEAELLALLLDPAGTPEGRVRRLASLGVVAGILFGSAAVSDIPDTELEPMIRSIAQDVLRIA